MLIGGARDLPERQRTLRATIDWSYSLLTPPEQTLFARLAVFAGGSTVESIEAICNAHGDVEVLVGMEALLDTNLVRQVEDDGDEPRLVMLETIHEYAQERLAASDEGLELRAQHAAYYLALAEAGEQALRGREQVVWLRRLEAEHDNLRAALDWTQTSGEPEVGLRLAGALWQFRWMRGYLSEERRAVEDLLSQVGSGTKTVAPTVRAKALAGGAAMAFSQGDLAQATAWGTESLRLAQAAGDQEGRAFALICLGMVAAARADYTQATVSFEESMALYRDAGNWWGHADVLVNLAEAARLQGDYGRAVSLGQEALNLKRQSGDIWGLSFILSTLAEVARLQGDATRAAALHEESLALSRGLGDRRNMAYSLMSVGTVAMAQGGYAQARALYQESLVLGRSMGNRENIGDGLEGLAGAVWGLGHPERAAQLFGAAAAGRAALGIARPPTDQAVYDQRVAAVRAALGEEEFARAWAEGQAMTLEQAIASTLEDALLQ